MRLVIRKDCNWPRLGTANDCLQLRFENLLRRSVRSSDGAGGGGGGGGGDGSRSFYCYTNPNDFGCNPAYIAAAVMSGLLIVTALLGVIIFLCVRHANAKRMLRVQAQLGAHDRAIFTVQQQQQQQQQQGGYPMSLMFLPEPPPYSCEDYTLPPDSARGAYPPPPYEEQAARSGSVTSMLSRLFSARRSRPTTTSERVTSAAASGISTVGTSIALASASAVGAAEGRRSATLDPNKPPTGFVLRPGPRDDLPPVS